MIIDFFCNVLVGSLQYVIKVNHYQMYKIPVYPDHDIAHMLRIISNQKSVKAPFRNPSVKVFLQPPCCRSYNRWKAAGLHF
jgi:hypothetical protein